MLFSMFLSGHSHSHIFDQLAHRMHSSRMQIRVTAPAGNHSLSCHRQCDWLYSGLGARARYRFLGDAYMKKRAESEFLRRVRVGDIAYPWPGHTQDLPERLSHRGALTCVEMINCHVEYSKELVQSEFDRHGMPVPDGYQKGLAAEKQRLELADVVFTASPLATKSLLAHGVPRQKICESSYAFAPQRLLHDHTRRPRSNHVEFLFVGLLCLRKGVARLIEHWREAKLENARLTFVGEIGADLPARYHDLLNADSIRHLPYTDNIARVYQEADVFVFPSFEEGGPLVTYEAMASRLPCLVSEAGAGAIVRDGIDGLIVQPDDRERWIASLRHLAADGCLRDFLAQNAKARAQDFTWDKVANRRRELILEHYDNWKRSS